MTRPSGRFFSQFPGERLWSAALETKPLPEPVRLLSPCEAAAGTMRRKWGAGARHIAAAEASEHREEKGLLGS